MNLCFANKHYREGNVVPFRMWTQVIFSISYGDNRYEKCLYGFKKVFLSENNNFCPQFHGFMYPYLVPVIFDSSIWKIDGTVTGTSPLNRS